VHTGNQNLPDPVTTPDTIAEGQASRARLAAAARTELARTGLRLEFAEPLRSRYIADIAAPRAAEQRRIAMICAGANLVIVPLVNLFVTAQPRWPIAVPHALTPVLISLVLIIWFFHERVPMKVRDRAMFAAAYLYGLVTLIAIWCSPPETALTDLFLVSLPLLLALFFAKLPFGYAVALTVMSAAQLAAVSTVHGHLAASVRFYPTEFMLCAAIPGLISLHRQERASRREYLNGILQALQIEQLAFENGLLSELSATDAVTGAANRRKFDLALAECCLSPPSNDYLMLADIDHFKSFNDNYGHLAGDMCLREVVRAMQSQLREGDFLARFGGEEFAVLISNVSETQANIVARRILAAVSVHRFATGGNFCSVTISIGVAPREPTSTSQDWIARADAALYSAKNTGRNCVRWSSEMLETTPP